MQENGKGGGEDRSVQLDRVYSCTEGGMQRNNGWMRERDGRGEYSEPPG